MADEVTLPGECAGNLQATESLPLRPALIKFSVSPDGQTMAVSCEDSTGTQAVYLRRQGEAWRKLTLPEKTPQLRAWITNGKGLWKPTVATLAPTNEGLWFVTFTAEMISADGVANGKFYRTGYGDLSVKEVFVRPVGGHFAFNSQISVSPAGKAVFVSFREGAIRIVSLTADGQVSYLPWSGAVPVMAGPLGEDSFVNRDANSGIKVGEKTVPHSLGTVALFSQNGKNAIHPADGTEVNEVLPTGTVTSFKFSASARPVEVGAASKAGLLMESGGIMLGSREFSDLYLGTTPVVRKGDVILGVGIQSLVRHATAIDDNGAIYFAPSGLTSRVFRLSSPRVVSVSPSTVSQGQDFVVTGDSLWIPGGPKTDLVLGAGAPVDACSARSSGELVCSSKNFPLGDLTFRVRISDGKNFPLGSQPARLTVLPPPAIAITGFTLSRPAIVRGETVDVCFTTSEAPSDGWFLSFKGAKTGSSWGIGIGTLGQTDRSASRSASMDDVKVANDHTCVTSRPNEDGEFQLLVGARGFRASAGPLPVTVEVPRPRLTVCEGEPSAVMPMGGTERLVPGGLARFCGEYLDGALVEFLTGFTETGEAIPEAMETVTTTTSEVVAKLPYLAGEIWVRVQREGLVSDWTSVQIATPVVPEPAPDPDPAPEPDPGEVVP